VKLPSIPLVVLDTETTGFVPRANRVIEFASIRVEDSEIVDTYEQLFAIPTAIPEPVQVLTHIRPTDLEGKPGIEDLREEILAHIGTKGLIVGQNVSFDLKMLKGEGIDLTERPWIDTSMLASLVFPELASYSLGYVSAVLKLNHEPVHRALGDVRATLELLERCWERLTELPPELHEITRRVMEASSPGYRALFSVLPTPSATEPPRWLSMPQVKTPAQQTRYDLVPAVFEKPERGAVRLVEEPLDPSSLQQILDHAVEDSSTVHWIAVKNLDATISRLRIPDGVRVIVSPSRLLDFDAAKQFAQQEQYTADEGTLALKLAWYEPRSRRELPLHGEEDAVWNGRLACTADSPRYREQFLDLPSVVLLDHWQLLSFLQDPQHVANEHLDDRAHIIIDDASMLEDTATKAYGWHCTLDNLRAAAEGDDRLMAIVDLVQLWIEKTRAGQDVHFLDASHLQTGETRNLRSHLEEALLDALPTLVSQSFTHLCEILRPEAARGRIVWIEERTDGTQSVHSVPERIDRLLSSLLYNQHPTTLLIPHGSARTLKAILPEELATTTYTLPPHADIDLPISIDPQRTAESILEHPPEGKTIVLLPSRRLIEGFFVTATEKLEKKGVSLICQNLSGGLQRLQAEFLAAKSPCVWLLTPWTYEGISLPPDTVDALFVASMPFDIPSAPAFARRSERFANAFEEYALPRLEHRLFRLLRTFCRHRTSVGIVSFLDERLVKKSYGDRLRAYVESFSAETPPAPKPASTPATTKPHKKRSPAIKKERPRATTAKPDNQLSLFS